MNTFTKIFYFCLIASLFFIASNSHAQRKIEVFAAEFNFFPSSGLDQPLPLATNLEAEIADINVRLTYPMVLSKDKIFLIHKFSYQYLDFAYENDIEEPLFRPNKLHELSYQLALRTSLSETWSVTVMANPNLATDFENIGGNHFKFAGGVVFARQPHRNFDYGLGARWTNDFGSGLVLPVLMLNYFNGSYFHADVLLPKHAEFFYLPSQNIEIGLAGRVKGNHYRVGEEATLLNNISTKDSRIKYSVITVGPALRIHTITGTYITIDGGVSLVRRFEVFDVDDTEINTLDLESKAFFRFGLQFRR